MESATTTCAANPKQRLQIIAMLRDDLPYWQQRTKGSHVGSIALQTAAAAAIRDYRDFVVNRKMCPKTAYNRLVAIGKDVIYQMFLGMFQLLSPAGVPTKFAQLTEALAGGIGKICEEASKKP